MKIRRIAGLLCGLVLAGCLAPVNAAAADTDTQVLQYQELADADYVGRVNYYYDKEGRCVREDWKASGEVVEYTYGTGGHPASRKVIRKNVTVEQTYYDNWGNPVEIRTYTDQGTPDTTTLIHNTYDEDGRLTESIRETEIDGILHCVQSSWDYSGQVPVYYNKGEKFTLGEYEQDGNTANGPEPIQWQILDVEDGQVLAISVLGLESRGFHDTNKTVTWENSDLRAWLNGAFLENAFSEEDSARIRNTVTEDCRDKIFVLSLNEAKQYFAGDSQRLCRASDYALKQGAYVNTKYGSSWWVLRTLGRKSASVTNVFSDGRLDETGGKVTDDQGVIRPVMWISMAGRTEPALQYYNVTEYTVEHGERCIQKKERYAYDEMGDLKQYYVETTSDTRSYDYTNVNHMGQLIHAACVITEYGLEDKWTRDIYYSYDSSGRKIRELHLYPGGDGYTDYTWEYDDQGRVLRYSDQYRDYEINYYGPLSQVLR